MSECDICGTEGPRIPVEYAWVCVFGPWSRYFTSEPGVSTCRPCNDKLREHEAFKETMTDLVEHNSGLAWGFWKLEEAKKLRRSELEEFFDVTVRPALKQIHVDLFKSWLEE